MEGDTKALAERHAVEHAESLNVPAKKMGIDVITYSAKASSVLHSEFCKIDVGCCTCKDIREFVGYHTTQGNEEVRITDPDTGGQKGQKLAQLGAIDPLALMEVGKVAGFGAGKYERYNYARGFAWSLSYDALQRHLHAFWGGENNDPESGLPHLSYACWHTLCLLTFMLRGRGKDDRFPQ